MKERRFLIWLLNSENKQNFHILNNTLWAKQHLEEIILTSWQKEFHNPSSSKSMVPCHIFPVSWKQKTFFGPLCGVSALSLFCVECKCAFLILYNISLAFGNTAKLSEMTLPALFTVVQTSRFSKDLFDFWQYAFYTLPFVWDVSSCLL